MLKKKENLGFVINAYQANNIIRHNNDNNIKLHKTKAVLDDSLLIRFLRSIRGINDLKGDFTTDIISIEFFKYSKKDIRKDFYVNGVQLNNKKYKMLFRTAGQAKDGKCIFIIENLFDKVNEFMTMSIQLPFDNAPLVEMGAYKSLITSAIVDTIKIAPKNILIIKDIESTFKRNALTIELDENDCCVAKEHDNYEMKNILFDGQALLDSSIFPKDKDGYMLLRNHFFKACAFKTHIKKFMHEHFKDAYESATVKDMFDYDVLVKDIKLITTENAIKWIKFKNYMGENPYKFWCDKIKNQPFGIVEYPHTSKLGKYQRMSYQMVNALDENIINDIIEPSKEYIDKLKNDNIFFLEHLKINQTEINDFEVLIALCSHNKDFLNCNYFKQRKTEIIKEYAKKIKSGKLLQNAENLVIVGSPFAMLLHSVNLDYTLDDSFTQNDNYIECYTERFNNNEMLAEFRNPFNSRNNSGILKNVYTENLQKYFDFGKSVIAVNMIDTDFQDRNNGSDQDVDKIYTTNESHIVDCAKKYYKFYPTIVNQLEKETVIFRNTLEDYAKIDNTLAFASDCIGRATNYAQLAQTYSYNLQNDILKESLTVDEYNKCTAILAVLAQVAIDNAKRKYKVNLTDEIERIGKLLNVSQNKYPSFYKYRDKSERFINDSLTCPMQILFDTKFNNAKRSKGYSINEIFIKHGGQLTKKESAIEKLIDEYIETVNCKNSSKNNDKDKTFNELIAEHKFYIRSIKSKFEGDYVAIISKLIDRAFLITSAIKSNKNTVKNYTPKNKNILIKLLYDLSPIDFLNCFKNTL